MMKLKKIKKIIGILILYSNLIFVNNSITKAQHASELTINISRMFGKEIFTSNGLSYLQPMVEAVNATSNSRFFNQAYVPKKSDKIYFKFGIHNMFGIVPNDKKTYTPVIPNEPFTINGLLKYLTLDLSDINNPKVKSISDTSGLVLYAIKIVFYDGIKGGSLHPPTSAPTIMGNGFVAFLFPQPTMDSLIRTNIAFKYLPKNLQDTILNTLKEFPSYIELPRGANINSIYAAVPQLEIGSFYGTELLLRYIPPIYMGSNIGHFSFWGIGLKHSLSQYIEEPPFDFAFQTVLQGTSLKNSIGITKADLDSKTMIWDMNIQASKHIEGLFDIFTGFSYEVLNINSDYSYYLPVDFQAQLGLLPSYPDSTSSTGFRIGAPDPAKGFPGDTVPQHANLSIHNLNYKWIIGLHRQFGPVGIFADYSISKFNLFTAGIEIKF